MFPGSVFKIETGRLTRRNERDRKVVVDVRVHPGECELDWRDVAPGASFDQRRPGIRRLRGIATSVSERIKEQVCEGHVEPCQEGRIAEGTRSDCHANGFRDLQVQLHEPRDSILRAERGVELAEAVDDGFDRLRLLAGEDLEKSRRWRRRHAPRGYCLTSGCSMRA
jgi:hypothetical protein